MPNFPPSDSRESCSPHFPFFLNHSNCCFFVPRRVSKVAVLEPFLPHHANHALIDGNGVYQALQSKPPSPGFQRDSVSAMLSPGGKVPELNSPWHTDCHWGRTVSETPLPSCRTTSQALGEAVSRHLSDTLPGALARTFLHHGASPASQESAPLRQIQAIQNRHAV